jgi:exonuclease SbcC
MIINSIELENIRSYDKEKIEFPLGITLFEGDIGSGKSTILMGIEFALFGLGSQKPEALLSKKANDGHVILNFEVQGQKCEVKRSLKRKGETLSQDPKNTYLKINDELEPLSPTELKQKILQILNFNEPGDPRSESRIYRYAVFTPQEEMKQILYDSTKRLETIRRAFGVEDYKIAIENSKEISRFMHEKMSIFKERFSNLDKHEKELTVSKENTSILEKKNEYDTKQKMDLETKKELVSKELQVIKEKKQEQRELAIKEQNITSKIDEKNNAQKKISSQIIQISSQLKDLEEEKKKQDIIAKPTSKSIEEINQKIKEFSDLSKDISNLEYRNISLVDDIKKLQTVLAGYEKSTMVDLQGKLQEIQKQKIQEDEKLEQLKKDSKILQKEEARLEADKESHEKSIQNISKLDAKCPTCEYPITGDYKKKLEEERRHELLEIETKLTDTLQKRSEVEHKISEIEKKISEINKEIEKIKTIIPNFERFVLKKDELVGNEKKLQEAKCQNIIPEEDGLEDIARCEPVEYFTRLKDKLVTYQNTIIRINYIEKNLARQRELKSVYEKEAEENITELEKLKTESSKIKTRLSELDGIEQQFLELEKNERALNVSIQELSNSILINNEKIQNEKNRMKDLQKEIATNLRWKQVYRKYSSYHDWINGFFIPTVDKIEKQVLLSIQQNFNEIYHRWYSILIDDPTKESRIDEEFTPIIEQDGYVQDIAFLSGGEKTSVALAYRLTLNSLMRQESESMKSNLLILDEPTDGFSKTQLAKVKTVLLELESQQIILVSHEKELETYVDNIFQINKNAGTSKVTKLAN